MREGRGSLVDPVLPADPDAVDPDAADPDAADWDSAAWDQACWEALVEAVVATGPEERPGEEAFDAAISAGEDDECWPPPGLLDEAEPGPLLADLLSATDLDRCGDADLVGVVRAAYRLQAWAAALEVRATNALVSRCAGWRGVVPDGEQVPRESVSAELVAAVEVGCALDLAPATARARVGFAREVDRLPATRVALAAGVIDVPKARLLVEELRPLSDEDARVVEQRVVAAAAGRTRAQLRDRLRRAVLAVDPTTAQARQVKATADRRVEVFPLPDGMASLAYLDTAQRVQALYLWLSGRAAAAKGPAEVDDRSLDQRRADVLGDLGVQGLAGEDLPLRHGRRPQVQVTVAATTLLGLDDRPGGLAGYGAITADTARRIAADGTWRWLLTDPRTGRFDELSVDTYEPPQDMVDHVAARDVTCRSPGCRQPASRCDLDHRVPHPRGPTAAANLQLLCRAHHTVKTHTATAVEIDGTAGLRFTLPSGRTYHRPAEPALEDAATDLPPF